MKNLLLFASLLAASLTANAATFQGSTSGTFENPIGPDAMVTTGVGTNVFTWGEGFEESVQTCSFGTCETNPVKYEPSKLTYTGAEFDTDVAQTFVAGYLNFYNGIINFGSGAETVDLSLTFNFTSPSLFSEVFTFGFSLNDTVNPEGDTATLLTSVPTKFYSYAGTDYYFELLGFGIYDENNNLTLIDQLFLEERQNITARLMGQFTTMPSEVPLPAAVWLFGSGLMGFMAVRRRAKTQA
ncbi:choice-of-anchor K domain-containing protein [Methylophaga sp.]|uniref:choice-of-anchor K domain-containing protein n=1 Tax=Methylophaga sp. TaxID=2024840 RepID=UPI00271E55E2|nr:choice-of-anchor K domain-containing protein [Methylophaga sp.]MDO8825423.1 choice-of-anchor K domain-containing protein [Methylophaga sp.]